MIDKANKSLISITLKKIKEKDVITIEQWEKMAGMPFPGGIGGNDEILNIKSIANILRRVDLGSNSDSTPRR